MFEQFLLIFVSRCFDWWCSNVWTFWTCTCYPLHFPVFWHNSFKLEIMLFLKTFKDYLWSFCISEIWNCFGSISDYVRTICLNVVSLCFEWCLFFNFRFRLYFPAWFEHCIMFVWMVLFFDLWIFLSFSLNVFVRKLAKTMPYTA